MTNHWNDLANSDCLMIIGCNPAENHPISFKWITKAQEKGAKLLVVDPRFTRSAAKADLYDVGVGILYQPRACVDYLAPPAVGRSTA